MNIPTMLSNLTAMTDIPPEPDWHDNAELLGELATLNARIARYVTRTLDADAKRGEQVSLVDEAALGRALVELGERLFKRSERQAAVDGDTTTAQAPRPPRWPVAAHPIVPATSAGRGRSHHTEEVGLAMSEPKNAGVKTLGLRLPDALHAQFTLVAQLDGMSLGDAAVKAVESYVEAKRSEPHFAERAQAALEEIEREAGARRGAIQGLFGTTAPAEDTKQGGRPRRG